MPSRSRVVVLRDVAFHELFPSSSGTCEDKVNHADASDTSTAFDAGYILTPVTLFTCYYTEMLLGR